MTRQTRGSPAHMIKETDPRSAPSAVEQRDQRVPIATRFAPEWTVRAVLAGCAIGALLAAGNVYTGLKTAYVDGGSITAAVVAFAVLATRRASARNPYSAAENNLTQTIASSAAVMSFSTGVVSAVPALLLSGHRYPSWAIALWGTAVGAIGIAIARSLRERLIVEDALPFPTGQATGEIIETMHAAGTKETGRAKVLLFAAIGAAAITWFRDGKPAFLPQGLMLPWGNEAMRATSLWLGVAVSPLMIAAGILIGPRGGVSVLVGAVGAWGILAPLVLAMKWVVAADYTAISGWLLWPGVALLVSSAITSLLMDWRGIARGLRDLRFWQNAPQGEKSAASFGHGRLWLGIVLVSVAVAMGTGSWIFGVPPLITAGALAFSFVMAGVSARAAGETDLAPTGAGGALGQLIFGSSSVTTSLFSGAAILGTTSQTAQTMWAFKAGHRLRANPHVQSLGQLIGLVVGAIVVVPVYDLVAQVYGLGTTMMPAPGAISWKATADAVQLGSAAMPPGASVATMIAFSAGILLTLLGNTRVGRFLPSAIPLGIAFVIPAQLGGAIFLGSAVFTAMRAWRPAWTAQYIPSVAAGAIAGESLMGILIAALLGAGWLAG